MAPVPEKWLFFDTNSQCPELHHRKSITVKQNFTIHVKYFTVRNGSSSNPAACPLTMSDLRRC